MTTLENLNNVALELSDTINKYYHDDICLGMDCSECPLWRTGRGCAIVALKEVMDQAQGVANRDNSPESQEVAQEATAPEPEPVPAPEPAPDLEHLRKSFSMLRDMVDPEAEDPDNRYLYCAGVRCTDCPFEVVDKYGEHNGCGASRLGSLLRSLRGL